MAQGSSRTQAQAVATLAMLQAGIEPVALALLAENQAVSPQDFGWIVCIGQIGMAGGALLGWLKGGAIRRFAVIAPLIGIAASITLPLAHGLAMVLATRLMLGVAMGLLSTRATATAARDRPHHAIGTVYLAQQLLSTVVLAGLPVISAAWGPAYALLSLAAAPLAIALLLRAEDDAARVPAPTSGVETSAPDAAFGAALVPMALMMAVTMMLWSYIGTIGSALGLGEVDIGFSIALGSLASAPPAALAAFSGPRFHPWLTAVVCGAGMLAPLAVPAWAGLPGYVAALILFNAGSTFGIIRFTAWAMEARGRGQDRRFVAMVQCAAMAGGPAIGAIAMRVGGLTALGGLATSGAAAAMLLPALRGFGRERRPAMGEALAG